MMQQFTSLDIGSMSSALSRLVIHDGAGHLSGILIKYTDKSTRNPTFKPQRSLP